MCPVLPEHKPFLVVQDAKGNFYIDHNDCFGLSSASSNLGMISGAASEIWVSKLLDALLKFEDDLQAFLLPSSSSSPSYNKSSALTSIKSLNIPWNEDKGDEEFGFSTKFCRDTVATSVYLLFFSFLLRVYFLLSHDRIYDSSQPSSSLLSFPLLFLSLIVIIHHSLAVT